MFQDAEFGIHHTLDTKRIYLLCTSNGNSTCLGVGLSILVILVSKVVHVFVVVSTNKVLVNFVIFLNEEHTRKHVVTDNLGQLRKRINRHPILIDIAINGYTISNALYFIIKAVSFAIARNVLWLPSTRLKGIQFVYRSITILIITTFIHICLWQVSLWNHGKDVNDRIGEGLSALCNHINYRA